MEKSFRLLGILLISLVLLLVACGEDEEQETSQPDPTPTTEEVLEVTFVEGSFASGETYSYPVDWENKPSDDQGKLEKSGAATATLITPQALKEVFGEAFDVTADPAEMLQQYIQETWQLAPDDIRFQMIAIDSSREMAHSSFNAEGKEVSFFVVELGNGENGIVYFESSGAALAAEVQQTAIQIASSFRSEGTQ